MTAAVVCCLMDFVDDLQHHNHTFIRHNGTLEAFVNPCIGFLLLQQVNRTQHCKYVDRHLSRGERTQYWPRGSARVVAVDRASRQLTNCDKRPPTAR